jgi:eight-cysteine-cluster-containing protein
VPDCSDPCPEDPTNDCATPCPLDADGDGMKDCVDPCPWGAARGFPCVEPPPPASSDCTVSGCSGQVCADQPVGTTCEFRPEYACYRNARCARQADGQCGWIPTDELRRCLGAAGSPAR